jgi:hypothetical protein
VNAPIPLFGLGLQGKSPNVTAQQRINLYAEIAFEQDKSRVAYFQLPGTTAFTSLGSRPIRGLQQFVQYAPAEMKSQLLNEM